MIDQSAGIDHPRREPNTRSARSVRTHVIGLIICVLLPLLIFSGFLVIRAARHEQNLMMDLARNRTRTAAASIDDELISLRGQLFLLAGRLSLQTSDLSQFHDQASEAFDGMAVVLTSPNGREIVNTSVAYGETLPDNPDLETIRYVVETQQPRIAELSVDPISHRPAVTINVPVTRDSQLAYVISLDISGRLPRILARLDLPAGWLATVFDRRGHLIGRSRNPERFVGQLARPEFVALIDSKAEGWVPGISLDGVPVFTTFVHTRLGGWTIAAAIPRDVLMAPVRQTILTLMLLGGVMLAMAIGLAAIIGRRIAAPVAELVSVAEAVGHGERAVPKLSYLTEANDVARSLMEASERLRRAAAEQREAGAALRESEQKYRTLAEDLMRVDQERTALLNRMVATQEDERKRIARELHDSLAQHLTALRLKVDALMQSDASEAPPRPALGELLALIGELGQAVNQLAWELRPVALDELGLCSAVSHYLEEWADMARLELDTAINLGGHLVPRVVETTLFRVLQEATTNVVRHAEATRVGVILEVRGREVRLIVEDDGKGFPAGFDETGLPATKQFGLLGMRERLTLVHGELEVETAPDQGTTLFIRIPLPPQQDTP